MIKTSFDDMTVDERLEFVRSLNGEQLANIFEFSIVANETTTGVGWVKSLIKDEVIRRCSTGE